MLQLSDDSGVALGLSPPAVRPGAAAQHVRRRLADRSTSAGLLVVAETLMGLLALALGILVATDVIALWHVFVLAGGLGGSRRSTHRSGRLRPEMVGPGAANAVSLNSTSSTAPGSSGPAGAGLPIGASGGHRAGPFVNAASFAFTIGALTGMRASS